MLDVDAAARIDVGEENAGGDSGEADPFGPIGEVTGKQFKRRRVVCKPWARC